MIITIYNYIGALIGAGFASGQEILTFFVKYGRLGGVGVVISSVIFGVFAYFILALAVEKRCYNYETIILNICNKRIGTALKWVTFAFSLGVYAVMMSCFGELCSVIFGWESIVGTVIMTIMCALLLMCGEKLVLRVNGILGIITVCGIIGATFYMLMTREQQTFFSGARAVAESGAYAGYNLLGAGVILCSLAKEIKSKSEAALVGIISGGLMFIMMSAVFLLLSMYNNRISLGELPMLTMAMRSGTGTVVVYSLMLICALITTAVAGGLSIIKISQKHIGKKISVLMISILALLASNAGFSGLISSVYRVLGYVGMILLLVFVILAVKQQKTMKKEENERLSEKKQV